MVRGREWSSSDSRWPWVMVDIRMGRVGAGAMVATGLAWWVTVVHSPGNSYTARAGGSGR